MPFKNFFIIHSCCNISVIISGNQAIIANFSYLTSSKQCDFNTRLLTIVTNRSHWRRQQHYYSTSSFWNYQRSQCFSDLASLRGVDFNPQDWSLAWEFWELTFTYLKGATLGKYTVGQANPSSIRVRPKYQPPKCGVTMQGSSTPAQDGHPSWAVKDAADSKAALLRGVGGILGFFPLRGLQRLPEASSACCLTSGPAGEAGAR